MEQRNKRKDDQNLSEGHGSDEVDRAESHPRAAPRSSVKTFHFDDSSPSQSSGYDRLGSPSQFHAFPHHSATSQFRSSSVASSDRFPSTDSLRSGSPFSCGPSSSKKVHSTLIRIQLGDDKKVSHEWYSEFASQSHHSHQQHKATFGSPLANRSANSSSQFEYDSHIAHMRGNFNL